MRSDKQITESVLQALLWDARVSPARIDVQTKNGHVRLSGTVDNFYKKWSAIENAMKVSEVVDVIDQIKVKPTDTVDDRVLQQNIEKTLSNDSRLEQLEIKCVVLTGIVSLHGEVHSYYQRLAAEESCRWLKGVINVVNHIKVVPRSREFDQKIRKRIEELIDLNLREDLHNIDITVENGRVLLSGQISGFTNKVYAETLASMVANVSFVQNEIKVKN